MSLTHLSVPAHVSSLSVAPHYFKPADLEQLASGDRKMPKAIGSKGQVPP